MLPPVRELDDKAAASLRETLRTLRRAFSEGVAHVQDFRETMQVIKELDATIETEEALEASMAIGKRHEQPGPSAATRGQPSIAAAPGRTDTEAAGKRVCCLVDGSYSSYTALQWAVEHCVDPEDDVFLLTVVPYEDYETDAARILQEAFDFAHHAGVKAARLHPRTLTAASGYGTTRGVGESVQRFVEGDGMELLVLGSRGLGSIKRSLLGSLGIGSVSDFCMQHLRCAILVLKEGADQAGPAAATTAAPQPPQ